MLRVLRRYAQWQARQASPSPTLWKIPVETPPSNRNWVGEMLLGRKLKRIRWRLRYISDKFADPVGGRGVEVTPDGTVWIATFDFYDWLRFRLFYSSDLESWTYLPAPYDFANFEPSYEDYLYLIAIGEAMHVYTIEGPFDFRAVTHQAVSGWSVNGWEELGQSFWQLEFVVGRSRDYTKRSLAWSEYYDQFGESDGVRNGPTLSGQDGTSRSRTLFGGGGWVDAAKLFLASPSNGPAKWTALSPNIPALDATALGTPSAWIGAQGPVKRSTRRSDDGTETYYTHWEPVPADAKVSGIKVGVSTLGIDFPWQAYRFGLEEVWYGLRLYKLGVVIGGSVAAERQVWFGDGGGGSLSSGGPTDDWGLSLTGADLASCGCALQVVPATWNNHAPSHVGENPFSPKTCQFSFISVTFYFDTAQSITRVYWLDLGSDGGASGSKELIDAGAGAHYVYGLRYDEAGRPVVLWSRYYSGVYYPKRSVRTAPNTWETGDWGLDDPEDLDARLFSSAVGASYSPDPDQRALREDDDRVDEQDFLRSWEPGYGGESTLMHEVINEETDEPVFLGDLDDLPSQYTPEWIWGGYLWPAFYVVDGVIYCAVTSYGDENGEVGHWGAVSDTDLWLLTGTIEE